MAMNKRVLRRKVIIREYDFNKIKDEATGFHYDGHALYDRVQFTPLNQDALEKIQLQEILKGKENALTEIKWNLSIPAVFLFQLRDFLYDDRYYNWLVTTDEDGYICVQARKNTPKTRIGWGVFEKDLMSKV